MANVRKRISELTALSSASLDTTIVGVDNGTTYKIELDVLADAVTNRVNALDRDRLGFLESVTSSFETKGRNVVSGSSQLTSSYDSRYVISGSITQTTWDNIANKPNGIVSQSTDLSSLNQFTSSQSTLNTAFTNGITGRLTTSSFNDYVASQSTSSLVDRLNSIENVSGSWITESETGSFLRNLNGAISSSSQLTSSYDTRYTLSGSVQPLPSNLLSSSAQISAFGFISSSHTDITALNSFTSSQSTLNTAFTNGISARLQTSSFNDYTSSVNNRITTLETTIISGSPNYTQVLGNRRTNITTTGVSIISGSITTTGNPVQIMVTGDANPINVTSWTRLQIYRDETPIGNIIQVENSSNLNVPYCLNVIDTPAAGTYSYSMRTVSGITGVFDFGESTGPLLTAVELKTNTNLPSTNNTFTGTNRFNGQVTLGGASGDEGGELQLTTAQTNTTLTGSVVSVDIYRDRLRIFEAGGNNRGVHIDLSKTPGGNAGELMWKASGMVGVGTFVSLDNLKCTITSAAQGNRGLSIGAVSTTFEADASGWYTVSGGSGGGTGNNLTYTTTASNSLFNWNFPTHGDMVQVNLRDKTNNRFYRITMMIGASYISNFISIERLF
jgi:hypothetical protein